MNRFLAFLAVLALSCDGGGGGEKTLDDFLPPLPTPDGTAQSVYAGVIADSSELVGGPAATGLVGDFFIRNSKVRFVIQNEMRSIAVSPWGGNVVDATLVGSEGTDSLGEVSMVYKAGRTCAHSSVEVLLDGSGGGPAVIRAIGKTDINDFINLKGMGALPIDDFLDPDLPDDMDCATTYVLRPDSDRLEIAWTLFNPDEQVEVFGPFGMLNDTGGENTIFYPGTGLFHIKAGFESLVTGSDQPPIEYAVYQGPSQAYGFIPLHGPQNAGAIIAGVNAIVFGVDTFIEILQADLAFLHVPPRGGVTHEAHLAVGFDAADIEASVQERKGGATGTISGNVTYTPSGDPAARARVGVFTDTDGSGDLGAGDAPVTFFDADSEGAWGGSLPAGTYFLRADVLDVARSAVVSVTVPAGGDAGAHTLEAPEPARIDYNVVDDETGLAIPAKLTVLGENPVAADPRIHPVLDRNTGVVRVFHAAHGTSVGAAPTDPVDAPLWLPAGGPYRVHVTRGPEWSHAQVDFPTLASGTQQIEVRLRRVVDTTGYVAAEFHQHSMASPDAAVNYHDRLASLAVEGIEFFASTDHDYIFDYAPIVEEMELQGVIRSAIGIEATPFAYGHFQAYPLVADPDHPAGGAIDWARGTQGFAMLPGELWQALRDERGAKIIQLNHPRSPGGLAGFQSFFDRAGLVYDFDNRGFYGAPEEMPIPASWLRLPEGQDVFSPNFDAIEVWNGFSIADTDGDGLREVRALDLVMRDWMNFLSFGKLAAPLGNSDSHTYERDAAGLPRSLIRVSDDSSVALASAGTAFDDEVWDRMLGGQTAQDIVVTNGPMLRVTDGAGASVIGSVVSASGDVTLTIEVQSADWVDFDTVEIFANEVHEEIAADVTALSPIACFSSRDPASMMPTDPCLNAPVGGAQQLDVNLESVGGGPGSSFLRRTATLTVTLSAAEIHDNRDIRATGMDAWLVVRVRGQKAVYPVLMDGIVSDGLDILDELVTGDEAEVEAALDGRGVPAVAFTAPILVDFDGGGWTAPFAP